MDNRRRRSSRTLKTDLPDHITAQATQAFNEYMRRATQTPRMTRTNNNQLPNEHTTAEPMDIESQYNAIHERDSTDIQINPPLPITVLPSSAELEKESDY